MLYISGLNTQIYIRIAAPIIKTLLFYMLYISQFLGLFIYKSV